AITLSACGGTNWGFPYRPTVQQGNWVTAEQVAQLQVGMSREQVRYVLGTPTLQDIFHADRWDYPYYNKPGYGEGQERRFTVWFEGDQLVRWAGDELPDRQPFQCADTGMPDRDDDTDATVGDAVERGDTATAEANDEGPADSSILTNDTDEDAAAGVPDAGAGDRDAENDGGIRPILNTDTPRLPPGVP